MRFLIIIFSATFIFSRCNNEKPKINLDNINQAVSNFQNLKGAWVSTAYIQEIEKTKSPLKSSEKLKGLVSFVIGTSFQGDSIKVDGSWNNHEGINFSAYAKQGQNPTHLKTNLVDSDSDLNYFELGAAENSTSITLYHYNKENQLLDSSKFTKVIENQKDENPTFGLQYVVNQKIISGDYTLTDEKSKTSKVRFNNDGKVIGIPNLKTYYINTDFMGGPMPTFDEIIFNIDLPSKQNYQFKLNGNTINLFSILSNEEDNRKSDKLKYHLVRL